VAQEAEEDVRRDLAGYLFELLVAEEEFEEAAEVRNRFRPPDCPPISADLVRYTLFLITDAPYPPSIPYNLDPRPFP